MWPIRCAKKAGPVHPERTPVHVHEDLKHGWLAGAAQLPPSGGDVAAARRALQHVPASGACCCAGAVGKRRQHPQRRCALGAWADELQRVIWLDSEQAALGARNLHQRPPSCKP